MINVVFCMLDTNMDARYEYKYTNVHKYELIETEKEKIRRVIKQTNKKTLSTVVLLGAAAWQIV